MNRGPSISGAALLAVLGTLMAGCSQDKVAEMPATMTGTAPGTAPVSVASTVPGAARGTGEGPTFPGIFGWSPANDVAPRFARPSASWALRIQEVSRESTR